jgi:hypothetical protein
MGASAPKEESPVGPEEGAPDRCVNDKIKNQEGERKQKNKFPSVPSTPVLVFKKI